VELIIDGETMPTHEMELNDADVASLALQMKELEAVAREQEALKSITTYDDLSSLMSGASSEDTTGEGAQQQRNLCPK
jgi:hypothetical protein